MDPEISYNGKWFYDKLMMMMMMGTRHSYSSCLAEEEQKVWVPKLVNIGPMMVTRINEEEKEDLISFYDHKRLQREKHEKFDWRLNLEEVKRNLSEYRKNSRFDSAGEKTEMRHCDRLSSIWSCFGGECLTNPCTQVKKNMHSDITGEILSYLDSLDKDNNEPDWIRGHIQRDPGLVDAEVKRMLSSEYKKNNRFDNAGEKTEMQFRSNIEEMLSHYKLSSVWSDFQCGFGEGGFGKCLTNRAKKDRHGDITGNMFSHLDNNELNWSNRNVPRDPEFEFQHGYTYVNNQDTRKEIVRRFSSFVVSTVAFLGIVYNIWNSQLSIINVPPLHKEHDSRLSLWLSLLELFGFMVFVCAVAVMILVGLAFTSMQKAMLIFWVILLHLQSANSISEVFVTLVGGIFLGWYAFGKKPPPNEVI